MVSWFVAGAVSLLVGWVGLVVLKVVGMRVYPFSASHVIPEMWDSCLPSLVLSLSVRTGPILETFQPFQISDGMVLVLVGLGRRLPCPFAAIVIAFARPRLMVVVRSESLVLCRETCWTGTCFTLTV